jgi:uncharacterized protein (TIGR02757 family)
MRQDLKSFLDEAAERINSTEFIEWDPVCIPHAYQNKQDIEISAFFSAIFAWGNRKTIIQKARELIALMDNSPYDFIVNHQESDRKNFMSFKHRTFQPQDVLYFLEFLQQHYAKNETLENAFLMGGKGTCYVQKNALISFHDYFVRQTDAPQRTLKHISTPAKNSTCKRLNMFLRWMVRKDSAGVDFGIWENIPVSNLMIPLDVHVEKTARILGLIQRKQRDWQAVEELTQQLRMLRPEDPVYYDYALFGLSIEKTNI